MLRAWEIINHAKVQVSKIFLDSDRSRLEREAFRAAMEILDAAEEAWFEEIENLPLYMLRGPRPFESRRMTGVN